MTYKTNREMRYNRIGVRIPKGATCVPTGDSGFWVIYWPGMTDDERWYADNVGFRVNKRDVDGTPEAEEREKNHDATY